MRRFLILIVYESSIGACLFGSAGRLDLPWFWAFIAVHLGLVLSLASSLDRGLMRERLRPGPGGEDRNLRWLLTPFLLAQLVVAGLDAGRFGWSGPLPPAVHAVGLVADAAGLVLALRAMIVNRFFSPVVRIQEERGHRLISEGPYRFIRHPGYAGMLLSFAGVGPALGSWWSLVPLIPVVLLIFRRLLIEDRYLREHLEGYAGYAQRVRYRLLPGVW